jgi:hypothetical protein
MAKSLIVGSWPYLVIWRARVPLRGKQKAIFSGTTRFFLPSSGGENRARPPNHPFSPNVAKSLNLGSLAATVGSQPLIFAWIAGSKPPLFASPSDLVCGPLPLGGAAWVLEEHPPYGRFSARHTLLQPIRNRNSSYGSTALGRTFVRRYDCNTQFTTFVDRTHWSQKWIGQGANMVRTSWVIVSFGEVGRSRGVSRALTRPISRRSGRCWRSERQDGGTYRLAREGPHPRVVHPTVT